MKGVVSVFDSSALCEKQAQSASDIIKAGQEAGVKKMNITLSQEAGLNFKAPIEGVNIAAKAGNNGTITIEVEYK